MTIMKLPTLILAVFFFIQERMHFGWGEAPKTDAAVIADGIAMILMAFFALISVITNERK